MLYRVSNDIAHLHTDASFVRQFSLPFLVWWENLLKHAYRFQDDIHEGVLDLEMS